MQYNLDAAYWRSLHFCGKWVIVFTKRLRTELVFLIMLTGLPKLLQARVWLTKQLSLRNREHFM